MRSVSVMLCLVVHLVSGEALGQTFTAAELFAQGSRARDRKDWETALMLFRMSHRIEVTPAVLMNMATCEEVLGKLASALLHYRQALALLGDSDEERRSIAEQSIAELGKRVGRLRLTAAAGTPAQVRLTVDGLAFDADRLGRTVPVDPGYHVIVVTASGHEGRRLPIHVAEGKLLVLPVAPGPKIRVARAPAPAPTPLSPVIGWTLLGGGATALGVGATFFGLAPTDLQERDKNEERFAATGDTEHATRANDASQRANTKLWIAGVASGVGAALVTGGIYAILSKPRASGAVKVAVGVAPGAFVGAASVRF